MDSLNLRNNFSNFYVEKIVRLAEIYAENFNIGEIIVLPKQLKEFIGLYVAVGWPKFYSISLPQVISRAGFATVDTVRGKSGRNSLGDKKKSLGEWHLGALKLFSGLQVRTIVHR